MKLLSIIVMGNNFYYSFPDNIEVLYFNGDNLEKFINKNVTGKYILFINTDDNLSENFFDYIINKCSENFDSCLINFHLEYDIKKEMKQLDDLYELEHKPLINSYIWSFIFDKQKLIEALRITDINNFNEQINQIFQTTTYINEAIIYHKPYRNNYIYNCPYVDVKPTKYFKNVIYVGNFCSGQFNGYISWLNNLGRIFGDKYQITILYDNLNEPVKNSFEKYFHVEKYSNYYNYICNRLLVTYSTYYYPKNIICTDSNYMFIHGNTADYKNARSFKDDIYSKYLGVSKIAADKAQGYYPTNDIDYVINPIKIDYELVQPHLKLVTAQRNDPIKRADRIELIASILDEENIPYTWNLFMDSVEHKVVGGLIYRESTSNPLPYINDADYYIQLSDSEAFCYSVVEALCLNTKVVVTPLECYNELNIKDGENAIVLPFDIFEPENKEKLREIIIKMYNEKDKKINYRFNADLYKKYNDIFTK